MKYIITPGGGKQEGGKAGRAEDGRAEEGRGGQRKEGRARQGRALTTPDGGKQGLKADRGRPRVCKDEIEMCRALLRSPGGIRRLKIIYGRVGSERGN